MEMTARVHVKPISIEKMMNHIKAKPSIQVQIVMKSTLASLLTLVVSITPKYGSINEGETAPLVNNAEEQTFELSDFGFDIERIVNSAFERQNDITYVKYGQGTKTTVRTEGLNYNVEVIDSNGKKIVAQGTGDCPAVCSDAARQDMSCYIEELKNLQNSGRRRVRTVKPLVTSTQSQGARPSAAGGLTSNEVMDRDGNETMIERFTQREDCKCIVTAVAAGATCLMCTVLMPFLN